MPILNLSYCTLGCTSHREWIFLFLQQQPSLCLKTWQLLPPHHSSFSLSFKVVFPKSVPLFPPLIVHGSWLQIWTQGYHFTQHSYSSSWRKLEDGFLYLENWFRFVSQDHIYLPPNSMTLLMWLLSHYKPQIIAKESPFNELPFLLLLQSYAVNYSYLTVDPQIHS